MNRKLLYIGLLIILGITIVGSAVYMLLRPGSSEPLTSNEATVTENGVSFNYPNSVIHRGSGPKVSSSHYATHDFFATTTQGAFDVSTIGIAIPVAPAPGEGVSLSAMQSNITKEMMDTPPQIEKVVINGHEAEKMVIDTSKIKGNSPETKDNVLTLIVLKSKYPDTVITLTYTRYEGDSSLDEAWQMILGSLNY